MFGRRQSKPLLVTTEVTTRVRRMTPPVGPALPLAAHADGARAPAPEDTPRAIRQSALVIGFLASGVEPTLLTDGVHAALTDPAGCALPGGDDRAAFALEWCASPDARRRLVATLALAGPVPDATGTRTRLAVAAWLRTSGYAVAPELLVWHD